MNLNAPSIPIISNLTGTWLTDSEAVDPDKWAAHIRRTVNFSGGISTLSNLKNPLFIDIGPGNPLATFARQHPATGPEPAVIQCAPHPRDHISDFRFMLDSLGRLWQHGLSIDWLAFNQDHPKQLVPLPGYPFAQTEFPAHIDLSAIQIPATQAPPKPRTAPGEIATATPPSEIERIVISAFESFFGISPVSVRHDFYDLGGDSLSAVQLADLIRQQGFDVNFRQLLAHPKISDFCSSLQSSSLPSNNITGDSSGAHEGVPTDLSNLTAYLTQSLKQSGHVATYNISPVQRFALDAQSPDLPTDFILFQQDVSTNARLADMTAHNPLMRSLIVRDGDDYKIVEYPSFPNLQIPFMDLSSLDSAEKEEQFQTIIRQLLEPIDLFQQVLFRPVWLKLRPDALQLVIAIHHLIFDGASISVLKDQHQPPKTTYRHYVEFLKNLDYEEISLGNHIDLRQYSDAIQTATRNFQTGTPQVEEVEIDLTIIPESVRHSYEDVMLLAFAELICRFFECPHAPIAQVSAGRVYSDARFTDVIGDFHDVIPLLLSPQSSAVEGELDRLRAYRRFIKDHNLNFLNYLQKHRQHIPNIQELQSPFGFNAVPATIDNFRRARALEPNLPIQQSQPSQPNISLQLYEDLHHQRLFIVFVHNSLRPVKKEFPPIISAIAQQLDGSLPR
jgi:aryl carrier-like protein